MQITGPFFFNKAIIISNNPSKNPAMDFNDVFSPLYKVGMETIFPIGFLIVPPPSSFRAI